MSATPENFGMNPPNNPPALGHWDRSMAVKLGTAASYRLDRSETEIRPIHRDEIQVPIDEPLVEHVKQEILDVLKNSGISSPHAANIMDSIKKIIDPFVGSQPEIALPQESENTEAAIMAKGALDYRYQIDALAKPTEGAETTFEQNVAAYGATLHATKHPTTTSRTTKSLAKAAGITEPTFLKLSAEYLRMTGVTVETLKRPPPGQSGSAGENRHLKNRRLKKAGAKVKWTIAHLKAVLAPSEPIKRRALALRLKDILKVPIESGYDLIGRELLSRELVKLSKGKLMLSPEAAATGAPPENLAQ
jgi:hypothetical protein